MERKHLKLIPPMQCDAGCGDCCGVVPATAAEYEKVVHVARAKGIVPVAQGLTCPFYQKGTCQVYDARPYICRFFGHSERLSCSRGYNVNVTREVEQKLARGQGQIAVLLHQALADWGLVPDAEVYVKEGVEASAREAEKVEPASLSVEVERIALRALRRSMGSLVR